MSEILFLVVIGFFVGTLGTMMGAGGGFILVPILLYLYPNDSPEVITSISLAVVFFNALSGTMTYALKKRIDYTSGVPFALASIPGALIGVQLLNYIDRKIFEPVFGIFLILGGAFLFYKSTHHLHKITESKNNNKLGIVISFFIGILSSFLGIGGGIIHVPLLIYVLGFQVQIATATSHFILAVTSFSGSLFHLYKGILFEHMEPIFYLSISVIIGAQLGAKLSTRVKDTWVIKSLSLAILLVGLRLIIKSF